MTSPFATSTSISSSTSSAALCLSPTTSASSLSTGPLGSEATEGQGHCQDASSLSFLIPNGTIRISKLQPDLKHFAAHNGSQVRLGIEDVYDNQTWQLNRLTVRTKCLNTRVPGRELISTNDCRIVPEKMICSLSCNLTEYDQVEIDVLDGTDASGTVLSRQTFNLTA